MFSVCPYIVIPVKYISNKIFTWGSYHPTFTTTNLETRERFVWHPPLSLFAKGDTTGRNAITGLAFEVFNAHKPSRHDTVGIPLKNILNMFIYSVGINGLLHIVSGLCYSQDRLHVAKFNARLLS
jgi:hypothetical protein